MRSLSGFLLLTAGLTVGAFAYYPGEGPHRDLAEITRIMTPGVEPSAAGITGAHATTPRLFSPQSPLVALDDPTRLARLERRPAPPERPKSSALEDAGSWSTVVTTTPAASAPHHRLSSTKPADDASRYELVRDLQRELKRVGCYHGEIDGDWGPGSKRAMSSFIERVNATLPTVDPDYILLMLVQGQMQPACGIGCPSGQVAGEERRCVPKAIVAQAQTKPLARIERLASASAPTQSARESVAAAEKSITAVKPAPVVADAIPPAPKPVHKMIAHAAEPGAAVLADAAVPPAMVAAREPLPGRMTIGGPVPVAEAPPVLTSAPRIADRSRSAEGGSDSISAPSRLAAVEPAGTGAEAAAEVQSEGAAPRGPAKPKRAARPAPRRSDTATWESPPPKKRSYSYASAPRRGASRPGTPRYNLLLSLGGVF
ncbi:MAG: hypothetical protein AB1749_07530 [Pseudomonadota bacterium]